MNGGDNSDVEDTRLVYMYDFLIRTWKIKNDVIDTMMRNPELYVRILIYTYRYVLGEK